MPPKGKPAAANSDQKQKDALMVFDALFNITSPVVVNVAEIASKTGDKSNTVAKRFNVIRNRYPGLNIQTTTTGAAAAGPSGGTAPATPKARRTSTANGSTTKAKFVKKSTPKALTKDEDDGEEDEEDAGDADPDNDEEPDEESADEPTVKKSTLKKTPATPATTDKKPTKSKTPTSKATKTKAKATAANTKRKRTTEEDSPTPDPAPKRTKTNSRKTPTVKAEQDETNPASPKPTSPDLALDTVQALALKSKQTPISLSTKPAASVEDAPDSHGATDTADADVEAYMARIEQTGRDVKVETGDGGGVDGEGKEFGWIEHADDVDADADAEVETGADNGQA